MEKHKAKLQEIKSLIESEVIDLNKIREISSNGCPNEAGIRPLFWKLLLNYIPPERKKWSQILAQRRNEYREFVREMIIRPGYKEPTNNEDSSSSIDHPLNSSPTSEWSSYFKDNQILVQIDKDVRRLCPDLFFFQKATEFPCEEIQNATTEMYQSLRKRVASTQLKSTQISKNRMGVTKIKLEEKKREDSSEYSHLPDGNEAHWEIVERILFIFAKLNPGNSYVQGMNEICGPIYYTFANDPDVEWRKHAEADCFFCFNNLMGLDGIRDNFCSTLDNTHWGINENMKRLYELVRLKDSPVHELLIRQNLKPEFFAFRWITLLLSQEFQLPEVISLWDGLFAEKKLFDFLLHVCAAMILLQRDELMRGDFSNNIKILQNYPPTVDIQEILTKARLIRR